MAQQPDLPGPTTSYSDPFYDRLEALAQRITKRLWLVLLALVVVVIAAVVTHAIMRDTPVAASAGRFLDAATLRMEADQARDPAERTTKLAEAAKAFTAVAADETNTPYYRARAGIELAQLDLDRSALSDAKADIEKARAQAAKALDPDLDLAVGLSEAAVLFQSGDAAAAESRYLAIERAAGLTHPDRQVAAIIGAAQTMRAQNRIDDAVAKLEPLITRNDQQAQILLAVAKSEYWTLKRLQATKPGAEAPAAPTPAAPTPPPAAAETPVAQPGQPSVPVAAPQSAPAAPQPAPAAPNPEGNK
jgi:hypothetical protein